MPIVLDIFNAVSQINFDNYSLDLWEKIKKKQKDKYITKKD